MNGTGEVKLRTAPVEQAEDRPHRHLPPPLAEGPAAIGWPEHWATAGKAGPGPQEPPLLGPAQSPFAHEHTGEPPARKVTLLGRLAGLVGTRHET